MAHRIGFNPPFYIPGEPRMVATQPVWLRASQSRSEELTPPASYQEHSEPIPQSEEDEGFLLPEQRTAPVSLGHDRAYFNADMSRIRSVHGTALFIKEEFIIKKHAMRYIDCPPFLAAQKIVAMTREEKHIVWQQGTQACVPAAISMIALDRKKTFLAKEITYGVTNNETVLRYIQKAGLEAKRHSLQGFPADKVRTLEGIIAKSGSGLLHLNHPDLKSHMVVLDEISVAKWSATLREPYHGYRVTVRLYPFMDWIGEEFIECCEPKKSNL